MPVQGYTVYIKIARIDKNGIDQTNTLQSLNQVTVPYSTGNITYEVIGITEHPTYYLYYVKPAQVGWADRAELGYSFSSSYDGTQSLPFLGMPQLTPSLDNLSFFLEGGNGGMGSNAVPLDTYRIVTYPQKDLNVRISSSVQFGLSSKFPTTSVTASLRIVSSPLFSGQTPGFGNLSQPTILATTILTSSIEDRDSATGVYFSGSYNLSATISSSEFTPGDCIYFQIFPQVDGGEPFEDCSLASPITFTNGFFNISSSLSTGLQVGLVPEPYFGENNFLRALDCQPLLNNAVTPRIHNIYQDVDYSAGATEPVNFDLLISGSAARAEVQISNYTTRRHVIPRYEGSKSTSQKLNTWTKGDTGTFGKTPTVESLKTVIAYCDWLGGWPPERMNASTAHVLYLIDADGNISVPNTSENSLPNIQGAFQTGERFRISTKTIGSGPAETFRNVIRGGQRIEPILYTQSGSAPSAQWNTTMSFEDIIPSPTGNTLNYQSTNTPPFQGVTDSNAFELLEFTYQVTGTLITNSKYVVPSGVINDGVNLKVYFKRDFTSTSNLTGIFQLYYRVVKERSGAFIYYPNATGEVVDLVNETSTTGAISSGTINIPVSELLAGDKIYVEFMERREGGGKTLAFPVGKGFFKISQYPLPTSPVTSSGYNSLWNWGDSNTYPNIITSSNPTLIDLFNETAKQTDIIGSGFNPISLPWSIEYGDEFRFEGREDFTYMVSKIFSPYESGSRVFPTGSIEVHFNSNLPTGSDTSAFNLDHFLIRRYVDDPSQIIFEGFKPTNSQGPYILTPEYSTAKLNTNIDDVISSLKERGLVTGEEGS